jgi:hypothetical protein
MSSSASFAKEVFNPTNTNSLRRALQFKFLYVNGRWRQWKHLYVADAPLFLMDAKIEDGTRFDDPFTQGYREDASRARWVTKHTEYLVEGSDPRGQRPLVEDEIVDALRGGFEPRWLYELELGKGISRRLGEQSGCLEALEKEDEIYKILHKGRGRSWPADYEDFETKETVSELVDMVTKIGRTVFDGDPNARDNHIQDTISNVFGDSFRSDDLAFTSDHTTSLREDRVAMSYGAQLLQQEPRLYYELVDQLNQTFLLTRREDRPRNPIEAARRATETILTSRGPSTIYMATPEPSFPVDLTRGSIPGSDLPQSTMNLSIGSYRSI